MLEVSVKVSVKVSGRVRGVCLFCVVALLGWWLG